LRAVRLKAAFCRFRVRTTATTNAKRAARPTAAPTPTAKNCVPPGMICAASAACSAPLLPLTLITPSDGENEAGEGVLEGLAPSESVAEGEAVMLALSEDAGVAEGLAPRESLTGEREFVALLQCEDAPPVPPTRQDADALELSRPVPVAMTAPVEPEDLTTYADTTPTVLTVLVPLDIVVPEEATESIVRLAVMVAETAGLAVSRAVRLPEAEPAVPEEVPAAALEEGEQDGVAPVLRLGVGDEVLVGEAEGEVLEVEQGVPGAVGEQLGVADGLAPTVKLCVGLALTVEEALVVEEGVGCGVAVGVALGVAVGVPVCVSLEVVLPLSDTEAVLEGLAPAVRLAVCSALTVLLELRLGEGVRDAVGVPETLGVAVDVAEGVAVGVDEGEREVDGVALGDEPLDSEALDDIVRVPLLLHEEVVVGVGVPEGVGVNEPEGVWLVVAAAVTLALNEVEGVNEGEAPAVSDAVGEALSVELALTVVDGVGVGVPEQVGVLDPVGEPVCVGEAVALPLWLTLAVLDCDAPRVSDAVEEALSVELEVSVGEGEDVAVPLLLLVFVPEEVEEGMEAGVMLLERDTLGENDMLPESDGKKTAGRDAVGVILSEAETDWLTLGVGNGVPLIFALLVMLSLDVPLQLCVALPLCVPLLLPLGVPLCVLLPLRVPLQLCVTEGVPLGVSLSVIDGVALLDGVTLPVPEGVSVTVPVELPVALALSVALLVALGVREGEGGATATTITAPLPADATEFIGPPGTQNSLPTTNAAPALSFTSEDPPPPAPVTPLPISPPPPPPPAHPPPPPPPLGCTLHPGAPAAHPSPPNLIWLAPAHQLLFTPATPPLPGRMPNSLLPLPLLLPSPGACSA
jgi:hypothetical protein